MEFAPTAYIYAVESSALCFNVILLLILIFQRCLLAIDLLGCVASVVIIVRAEGQITGKNLVHNTKNL